MPNPRFTNLAPARGTIPRLGMAPLELPSCQVKMTLAPAQVFNSGTGADITEWDPTLVEWDTAMNPDVSDGMFLLRDGSQRLTGGSLGRIFCPVDGLYEAWCSIVFPNLAVDTGCALVLRPISSLGLVLGGAQDGTSQAMSNGAWNTLQAVMRCAVTAGANIAAQFTQLSGGPVSLRQVDTNNYGVRSVFGARCVQAFN